MQKLQENPFINQIHTHNKLFINREYKSSLFAFLFTYDKQNALSLYNGITGKNYTNPEDLEYKILDNALFLRMRNDVSFIFDKTLSLYEHQSTFNPNMPLRGLFYYVDLCRKIIDKSNLLSPVLVKIPRPQYIVFYNGADCKTIPDEHKLFLSDAFYGNEKLEGFEWTATILNINLGHNKALMDSCKVLSDYSSFVEIVRKHSCQYNLENAILKAIDECLAKNILRNILSTYRWEVAALAWTEFDEEEYERVIQEQISELKGVISTKDEIIAEKDETIAEKDETIAEKDETIAEKNETIKKLTAELEQLKNK